MKWIWYFGYAITFMVLDYLEFPIQSLLMFSFGLLILILYDIKEEIIAELYEDDEDGCND